MIRIAQPADFDFTYELYMHPQVNPFLLYELMGRDEFKPIFEDLLDKGVKFLYGNEENPWIGMFKLVPLTHRTDHIAYLGGLAIHPDFSGKGHGRQMIREILAHAKQQGLLRIELSTATINQKAIRLYEKMGFEKEGILRKYTHLKKENKFLDEVLMSYLF
jgi:putative acetyltransferase